MSPSRQTRHAILALSDYRLHGENAARDKCTDNSLFRVGNGFLKSKVAFKLVSHYLPPFDGRALTDFL